MGLNQEQYKKLFVKEFTKATAGFLLQCETVPETWRQVDSPGYDHG
jgi:hypothetical protein